LLREQGAREVMPDSRTGMHIVLTGPGKLPRLLQVWADMEPASALVFRSSCLAGNSDCGRLRRVMGCLFCVYRT